MSDPRIQPGQGVNYTASLSAGTRDAIEELSDEEFFEFEAEAGELTDRFQTDKKLKREVDGEMRDIRIGKKDGKKYRYTADTKEELITKTTGGKNTYLTKTEFDRQVKEMLGVDTIPESIKPELRDGFIVFINKETGLTMSAHELRANTDLIAAQKAKEAKNKMNEISLDFAENHKQIYQPQMPNIDEINIPTVPTTTEVKTDNAVAAVEEKPRTVIRKTTTKQEIIQNFDVRQLSNATAEELNTLLAHTPLKGKGQVFKDAEEKYGINAYFLMGITRIESSYGKHVPHYRTKSGQMKSTHNLGGITGSRATGGYRDFADFDASIDGIASLLSRKYIPNGKTTPIKIAKTYTEGVKVWTDVTATVIQQGAAFEEPDYLAAYQPRTVKVKVKPKAQPKPEPTPTPEKPEVLLAQNDTRATAKPTPAPTPEPEITQVQLTAEELAALAENGVNFDSMPKNMLQEVVIIGDKNKSIAKRQQQGNTNI